MSTVVKIIILGIVLFAVVVLYACILAAATADEDAERMFREYEERKHKHRKEAGRE